MKEQLQDLLEICLEAGTEEDLENLTHLLTGVKEKIVNQRKNYIDDLLKMNRKIDLTNKTCEIKVPLHSLWNNSLNIVHGGITATVLDTAMGTLANSILPPGKGAVTNQLNIHYTAPLTGDTLLCKAEIIHQGNKTFVISAEAFRSDGKKAAYATGTFFVINK